jgi:molybdenum cofactor cytidylyltransferase
MSDVAAPSHPSAPRVAALVPAAGASRRMGTDKRRLPYRGRTVLEVTVNALRNGGCSPIVVVLEPDSACAALPGLAGTILVVNPHPERGMLSSIRTGLAALPPRTDAVAVLPGDHPFVPAAAVQALLADFAARRPLLLLPRYAGRRGHPLLIGRSLFAEAARCDDHVGLRQLLHRHPQALRELPLDFPGADDDLDQPAHRERLDRP